MSTAMFSYYATWDDSLVMLRDLLGAGLKFIPDLGLLDSPTAQALDALPPELEPALRKRRALFLSNGFSRWPPSFDRIASGPGAGKYFVQIGAGGPFIRMTLAAVNEVEGQPVLVGGAISHPQKYRDPAGQIVPASVELRDAFDAVRDRLEAHLVAHRLGTKLWITPAALDLLKAGEARIIDHGVLHRSRR